MTLSITPVLPITTAQAATLEVALQPGTVVTAQVLQRLDVDLMRIMIANLTLDAVTTLPLQAGQTLQLAVMQTKDGISLAPVVIEPTGTPRGDAVTLDDIPLAPKVRGQGDIVRAALSPAETKAVAVAAQTAVTRQTSLSPLFANLASAVTSGALPQSVLVAATQLLGLRQSSDRVLTGADIKTALASSGLVLESSLAAATSLPATSLLTKSSPVAVLPDMKAALTVLRQALSTWIGEPAAPQSAAAPTATATRQPVPDMTMSASAARATAVALSTLPGVEPDSAAAAGKPPAMAATSARLVASDEPVQAARTAVTPPPFRDALPAAQAVMAPSLAPDPEPAAIVRQLIADTDGALARQTLLQIASLPDQIATSRNETLQPRWNFEIPFVTAQGTAMVQFAISRDGAANEADPAQRVWRARFSLDIEPAGPVHALISFSNDTTSVKMWAERPSTAAQLRANALQLGESLDRAELKAGDIVVADGAPSRAKAPVAGHFLNRAS